MISELKLQFLDELTNEERSIFLYCFVFKIPKKITARHLKMSFSDVSKHYSEIENHLDVYLIQSTFTE